MSNDFLHTFLGLTKEIKAREEQERRTYRARRRAVNIDERILALQQKHHAKERRLHRTIQPLNAENARLLGIIETMKNGAPK